MRRLQLDSDDESEDGNEGQNPQDELTRYLKMPAMEEGQKEEKICQWWKDIGKPLFPRFAKVARAILAIQASSTASEREFSAAGLTLCSRRSSMDPEHVNELLVVRSFYKK